MTDKLTAKISRARVLRVQADAEITRLHNFRSVLKESIDRVEHYETLSDPTHKKDAEKRLAAVIVDAENVLNPHANTGNLAQIREGLIQLSDSNQFSERGNAHALGQRIRLMRGQARRILREMPS